MIEAKHNVGAPVYLLYRIHGFLERSWLFNENWPVPLLERTFLGPSFAAWFMLEARARAVVGNVFILAGQGVLPTADRRFGSERDQCRCYFLAIEL